MRSSKQWAAAALIAFVVAATAGYLAWRGHNARWSATEARSRFAAMDAPREAARDQLNQLGTSAAPTDYATACTRLGAADTSLAGSLSHGRWPSSVTYAAQQFAAALRQQATDLHGCALAATSTAALDALGGMTQTGGAAAAMQDALSRAGGRPSA